MDEFLLEKIKSLESDVRKLQHLEAFMAQNYGWIGGAWQKDPLKIGYSGAVRFNHTDTNLSGSAGERAITTVPAGEVWWVQSILLQFAGTLPADILFYAPYPYVLYNLRGADMTSGVYFQIPGGPWLLEGGEAIKVYLAAHAAGDDLYIDILGMRVDVDQ